MDSNLDSEQMSVSKEQDESSTVSLEKISSDDSIPKADNDEISSYAHEDETLNVPAEPSVDLPLSSTDDLSFSHSNLEASEAPPLQLFDNDSKTMDEDSVFGGELAEIPDQILAETEEPDEPISNIEDELRNLEGSEEEEISHVPILSCNERIDNLVDALCDSGSSKPAESDEKMNADVSSLSESEKVAESINVSTLSLPDNSSNDAFEQVDLNSMEKEKSLNIEDNDVLSDDRTQTAITAVSLPDETHNDESMEAESSQSGLAPDDHLSIPEKTARTEDNSQREEEDDKFDSKNASIEDVEMSSIENQTETSENIAAVDDPLISQVDHEIDDKTNDENEDVEMATVEKQTDSSEKNDAEGDLEREDGDDLDCEDGANLEVTKERTENDADKGIATDTAQENSNIEENEPEDLTTEPQVDYPEEFNSTADIADDSNKTTDESAEKRPRSITRLYRKSESSDADKTIERRSRRRGISNSPVSGILESNKKKDVSNPQPSRSRRRFRNLDGSSEHSTPDNSTTRSKSGDEADDTVELNELKELQIKELDRDLTDEKCSRCRKVKQCRYKYMQNGDIKYLCNLKCVDGFRTTSKEPYQLIARRIVISLIFESVYYCEQCKKKKNCRYRFKMPPDDNFVYICDAQCFNQHVGKNVEKYFRRRKTYLVQENENGDTEKLCIHCCETKLCKYSFKDDDNSVYHICSDDCFNLLAKEENDRFKLKRRSVRVRDLGAPITTSPPAVTSEPKIIARSEQEAEAARLDREVTFIRRCAECLRTPDQQMLEWETVHFCNDICLEKYQKVIGATCTTCARAVPTISMGKYCVRFGFEIRQFCTAGCLDTFKKGLKVCSFCQKDISHDKDGFLAPVGEKSQFKDFCSQDCMKSYDDVLNPRKKQNTRNCAVCNIDRVVRVEIILDNRDFEFCSNPCFSAFKFVNNISPDECAMCLKYFERKSVESYTLYVEGVAKVFCRKICMNIFIILNRKIVSCRWCKVKKYNFDMILTNQGGQVSMLCSVNCLRQFSSLGNAALVVRLQKICDQCHKNGTPMYNLSMSDSTLRNFCTYQCVMAFQGSYTRPTTDAAGNIMLGAKTPYPVGLPKKIATKDKDSPLPQIQVAATTSLAIHQQSKQDQSININSKRGRPRRRKQAAPEVSQASEIDSSTLPLVALSSGKTAQKLPVSTVTCHTQTTRIGKKTVGVNTIENAPKNQIVTIPQVQPTMVNKQTMCKPSAEMLAQQARRPTCTVECQTDASLERKFFIPIPIPIYVPQPMHMYSLPVPIPVPFPLPIPVPIFIPTTRNSAEGIMKEIKKIQDKMPSDPFEAELLMMAEMVAGEKKQNESDSEPEDDADEATAVVEFVPDTETTSNFGEDVLQMALKLATEYEEPAVDLESAMQTNTITQSAPQLEEVIDEDLHQQHLIMIDPQRQIMGAVRNPRKRAISPSGGMPRNHRLSATPQQKRQRLQHIVSPTNTESIRNSTEQTEKPDAHMCLKYTFGVNAWKQWVMTKNSDLEKSSIRRKPFKSELLQLTADELNYSLCLFVKEVRKPNGSEYAPDTIYYLVLGIQQYLYENERIDNIFTDPYYERFTDCLDEVSRRFSVLYNDSQYIVTRVEEEHLWECKQLGAHSPHVLLSTLMFFNTKHFNLTTVDEHMQLSFSHIMKHWKRSPPGTKTQGSRNVLLRFYPPQTGPEANPRKKKVYEQQENESDPLRCPVKLYEFYLSKCPESVKTRSDVFYLQPERSCVPDSPVWYSTQPLSRDALIKMLHRVKMVKEINIALLSS